MKTVRSLVFRAVCVVVVFLGTIFLSAASFGAFSRPPVMHTSFVHERGSLLGLVANFLLHAQFLWPFAIGAFVLESFIFKRRGYWWALGLGILPTLAVAAGAHSSFSHDMLFIEYLEFALVWLSPTLWAMIGFALGYLFSRKSTPDPPETASPPPAVAQPALPLRGK